MSPRRRGSELVDAPLKLAILIVRCSAHAARSGRLVVRRGGDQPRKRSSGFATGHPFTEGGAGGGGESTYGRKRRCSRRGAQTAGSGARVTEVPDGPPGPDGYGLDIGNLGQCALTLPGPDPVRERHGVTRSGAAPAADAAPRRLWCRSGNPGLTDSMSQGPLATVRSQGRKATGRGAR